MIERSGAAQTRLDAVAVTLGQQVDRVALLVAKRAGGRVDAVEVLAELADRVESAGGSSPGAGIGCAEASSTLLVKAAAKSARPGREALAHEPGRVP
jgi:hypothetical protein